MALSYECGVDLAFDTDTLRSVGKEYRDEAATMRGLRTDLATLLSTLASSGWTTKAGKAFQKMVEEGWAKSLDRYCDLLDTLSETLEESAGCYDQLVEGPVKGLKIQGN